MEREYTSAARIGDDFLKTMGRNFWFWSSLLLSRITSGKKTQPQTLCSPLHIWNTESNMDRKTWNGTSLSVSVRILYLKQTSRSLLNPKPGISKFSKYDYVLKKSLPPPCEQSGLPAQPTSLRMRVSAKLLKCKCVLTAPGDVSTPRMTVHAVQVRPW